MSIMIGSKPKSTGKPAEAPQADPSSEKNVKKTKK